DVGASLIFLGQRYSGARTDREPRLAPGLSRHVTIASPRRAFEPLVELELRHRLELVLGGTAQNRVVRIPLRLAARRGRGGRRPVRAGAGGRRAGGRGASGRLVDEFQLAHVDLDVVLAHAEEAADADHHAVDLAGLVDQHFADVAELLVLIVIDVQTDQLR